MPPDKSAATRTRTPLQGVYAIRELPLASAQFHQHLVVVRKQNRYPFLDYASNFARMFVQSLALGFSCELFDGTDTNPGSSWNVQPS